MDKPETFHSKPATVKNNDFQFDRNGLLLIVAVVIVVILMIAAIQQPDTSASIPLQPTVTLGTD